MGCGKYKYWQKYTAVTVFLTFLSVYSHDSESGHYLGKVWDNNINGPLGEHIFLITCYSNHFLKWNMENDIWIYHIVLFLFGFHLEFNLISKGSVVVATVDSWKF